MSYGYGGGYRGRGGRRGRTFRATWSGLCPRCECPIERGHLLTHNASGDVVHASCSNPTDAAGGHYAED